MNYFEEYLKVSQERDRLKERVAELETLYELEIKCTVAKLRANNERTIKILAAIEGFIVPNVEGPDGVVYHFNDPDPHKTLRALSNAIKQIHENI